MRGKTYKAIKEKAAQAPVSVSDAVTFIKEHARKSFDETIELHVNLGINASKSDQMVRGSVQLPSGSVKKVRIAVITDDAAKQKAAKTAGATIVGGQNIIDEVIANGSLDADIVVTSPDMMPKLAKAAKVLGPKGLMPNPKTGTVTPDVEAAVKGLAGGKISFKMDQLGNIHEAVGKASWEAEKIVANIDALLETLRGLRPAAAKGEFFKSITVCSSMGPAVRVAR